MINYKFEIVFLSSHTESKLQHSTIVLTNTHIALLGECHQWPLSRLHPPPNQIPSQFKVHQLNKITNIVSMVSLHFLTRNTKCINVTVECRAESDTFTFSFHCSKCSLIILACNNRLVEARFTNCLFCKVSNL